MHADCLAEYARVLPATQKTLIAVALAHEHQLAPLHMSKGSLIPANAVRWLALVIASSLKDAKAK